MEKTIDMQLMRYLNLFEKICKVVTKHVALYNSAIIFFVNAKDVSRAIGENGKNIRQLNEILNKKIKVVALPYSIMDIQKFFSAVIYPTKFKNIEIKDNEVVINAGRQSKAILIGRNKARLAEMQKISQEYFGKSVRIV